MQKKPLRQRWHVCDCGVSAQRDLYSAYLARFVNPDTSVLKARQAADAWRRGEPLVQAATQHATLQPTREWTAAARLLWSASG